jgi:hypothetical protein
MSIEELVLRGMGFVPKAEPEPIGRSGATATWWRGTQPVTVQMPDPSAAGYGMARDKYDHGRRYVSPLGGLSGPEWSKTPRFGDDALRPEFRRSTRKWG